MSRIRMQSSPPLPSLKAWFLVPVEVTNIRDLKVALCSQLSILKDMHLQPTQLVLEMDGFEVLEESPIDLVREGDVVMVRRRETIISGLHIRKRKISTADPIMAEKRRKVSNEVKSSPSSSSTSSAKTSDSSDSESSSTSSSSSSSDSDSSTSSDSAPPPLPTKKKLPLKKAFLGIYPFLDHNGTRVEMMRPKKQQSNVPPGFGKPSTQSRNNRRKIKRRFTAGQTVALEEDSPSISHMHQSEENGDDVPIVLPYDDAATESFARSAPPTAISRTPSASLGNRNKSKGFKKAMEGAIPQKVVFKSATPHASSPATPSSSIPPFIAPSERNQLPKNLFVTSVDVEWRTGQGRGQWQNADEKVDQLVEEVQVVQALSPGPELQNYIDWTIVEAKWGKYGKLQTSTTLLPGNVIGWKAFGLDPVTLTPQASLLHLGKVVAVDSVNLVVSPLVRPGIGHATFGRATIQEVDEGVDPVEQISLPLSDVWSNDWRLVSKQ